MSTLPEAVDAWRMVATRRIFSGTLPLSSLTRLVPSLADGAGTCSYRLEFGRDEFGVAFVQVEASAALPLICQRSLTRFEQPVTVAQRLGLIRTEREEAALPGETEPRLVPEDGRLSLAELVEDELILALPVVPVSPDSETVDRDWSPAEPEVLDERPHPFAALSALKQGMSKK